MKVTIEYCAQCNYHPQAAGLAAELREVYGELELELVPSKGGAFEISVDGVQVFSKLAQGRFPAYRELPGLIG